MMSNIEWTEATWNPITGCSRISSGCVNCYAETMTKRLASMDLPKYQGLLNEEGRFNAVTRFDEETLLKPLTRKKPTMYFVNSMSDLFHESVPDEWIDKVFAVMALSQHTFQVLTKRPERMLEYFRVISQDPWSRPERMQTAVYSIGRGSRCVFSSFATLLGDRDGQEVAELTAWNRAENNWPLPNVWLGVSAENQEQADARIPFLLETPAAVRFVSAEPLLSGIDFSAFLPVETIGGVELENWPDWVIVGGESGPKARPCHVEWIESIVGQCRRANVPVFVKQMGSHCYDDIDEDGRETYPRRLRLSGKGGDPSEWPEDLRVREMPKGEARQ